MLFENISLTIFEGRKVALVARNGAGKSTLLDILAGKETPDSGKVTVSNGVSIGYFEQFPVLNPELTVLEEIFSTENEKLNIIREFELALEQNNQEKIALMSSRMDALNAWDAEVEIKQILTLLKITKLESKVSELSGGQQKRLALAKVLVSKPDLLLLDEPTNHLDLEMIEWLEKYLENTRATVLMVTHDRYFLDRVCDEIIEMEDNQIYRYEGNYSWFLQKRDERLAMQQASVEKAKNLLRTELEWMRRMPKARSHKARYRVDAFDGLQEKASEKTQQETLTIHIKSSRLGKKIVELHNVSKSFTGVQLIENFSYKFSRYEKVGVVGNNGTGKSTFLNLITGALKPDSGTIEVGQTVKFGYYRQEGISFDPHDRVIDAVNKIAEFIYFEDGTRMSASQMLSRFLFPPNTQYNYIGKLSGGEKRRLYLCTVLMQNPNFLILDEPTNDLDIVTLNVLEEYLSHFGGCVLVVSHDRFFMDKIVDHIFVFEGNGIVADFPGNYTVYRNQLAEKKEQLPQPEVKEDKIKRVKAEKRSEPEVAPKRKMTFKEKREFELLEAEIKALEESVRQIEDLLNSGMLEHNELYSKSEELSKLKAELDDKELRWLELSELL